MKTKVFFILAAVITLSVFSGGTSLPINGTAAAENTDAVQLKQIEGKLDQVLLNQAEIFKRLGKIEQELAIVKIRATR